MEKLTEVNTFRVRNESILNIFDQNKVSMVHCESGIAIFAERVISNYAYSLFNPVNALNR